MVKKTRKQNKKLKVKIPVFEHILGILVIMLLFAIDRITKDFAPNKTFNYGISFSLFQGFIPIVIIITLIFALFLLAVYLNFKRNFRESLLLDFGFIFLISGTLGNLFDRIFYGYVIDFINISSYFPNFNLADVFNFIGVILFILFLLKNSKKGK